MLSLPPSDALVWPALLVLATWRLAAMLVYDSGPGDIFVHLRRLLVRIRLERAISCFHCISFWVALVLVVSLYEWAALTLLMALAVAGGASIIERFLSGAPGASDINHE